MGTSTGTYIFDELEEQIYLSGTGLCVHSLTALLRVVGLWLFLRLGLCVWGLASCPFMCLLVGSTAKWAHHWCDLLGSAGSRNYQQAMQNLPHSIGIGSEKKPFILLIWSWLVCLPDVRELHGHSHSRAVCVFSTQGRGRQIKITFT